MSFLRFARRHARFLAFGLLTAFFSSFGQTYYIGAYGDVLRETFDLSYGRFGALYSLATLTSAGVLVWSGRFIDDLPLRRYATLVSVALIAACAFMSLVPSMWLLGVGLFLLRQTGQGLMSHTAVTSLARRFSAQRGRALSVGVLGYPLGQAVLPLGAVALTRAVGWRQSWLLVAVALAVVLVPLQRWLLRGHDDELPDETRIEARRSDEVKTASPADTPRPRGRPPLPDDPAHPWTRADVLRDPRFWLVTPAMITSGFIVTGVFFHQTFITDAKGWDLAVWTGFFTVFAACQIGGSIAAGPLIDRFSAVRLLPTFLLPLGAGLLLLGHADGLWLAPAFLALSGVTAGLGMTLSGALWAELYGVTHLGAIRSAVTSLGILGTAASPVSMGALIDAGVGLTTLGDLAAATVVLATAGAVVGVRLD